MINTIGFPDLGLQFHINRVAFSIFGHPIYWYALILLTGFVLGAVFVGWSAKKEDVSTDTIWDIALWGLIFGLIGARLYYVLFDLSCLDGNWLNIFKIWEGGIAIYGAIIGAVLSTYVYCRRHKLPVLKIFDLCCVGLLIGQCIGRWGNFVNAEVFGHETTLPWRMTINANPGVHPLFLYESLWNLVGFLLILLFKKKKTAHGQIFFFYCFWYGLGRLLLEGMRQSQYILYVIPNVLGISQLVALCAIIVSVVCFILVSKHNKLPME